MLRNVSVCIFASVAVLLLSSDANACRRSRTWCCGSGYGYHSTSYGCCGVSGYGNGSVMATGAMTGTDTAGTVTSPGGIGGPASGLGVRPGVGVGGLGREGYNPGGIGGPASGVGVRPGLGAGGLGRGR